MEILGDSAAVAPRGGSADAAAFRREGFLPACTHPDSS